MTTGWTSTALGEHVPYGDWRSGSPIQAGSCGKLSRSCPPLLCLVSIRWHKAIVSARRDSKAGRFAGSVKSDRLGARRDPSLTRRGKNRGSAPSHHPA